MNYTDYINLSNEFLEFSKSEIFKYMENDSIAIVSLADYNMFFVAKKIVENDRYGIVFINNLDAIYTFYLLQNAVSEEEAEALLADKRHFVLFLQDSDTIPYNFKMYNSAAGIKKLPNGKEFYGYAGGGRYANEFLGSEDGKRLCNLVGFMKHASVEEVCLTGFYSVDAGALQLRRISDTNRLLDGNFQENSSTLFNLTEQDKKTLFQLEPALKLKNLCYEIDFNMFYIDDEDDFHNVEIMVSTVVKDTGRCVYLETTEKNIDLATCVLRSFMSSVLGYKYPYKIICRKNAVRVWLETICKHMNIELELVEKLESTDEMYKKIKEEK